MLLQQPCTSCCPGVHHRCAASQRGRSVLARAAAAATAAPQKQPASDWRKRYRPLLEDFIDTTIDYMSKETGQCIDQQQALGCLTQDNLIGADRPCPGLLQHLYDKFRQRKVRVAVGPGKPMDLSRGISYLDPRRAADILHPDRDLVSKGVHYLDAPKINCAEAVKRQRHQLAHLQLLCVGVLHNAWKDRPEEEHRYKTWPLECCWCERDGETRKGAGDAPWPDVSPTASSAAASAPVQGPLPLPKFVLAACLAGPTAAAVAPAGSGWPLSQLSQGFINFTDSLAPTDTRSAGVVMDSLTAVLQGIAKRYPWSVAQVLLVGSAKTRTGLRITREVLGRDLDVQVELDADNADDYELAKKQCRGRLYEQLCARGWQGENVSPPRLKLHHPELLMRLDVQFCWRLPLFAAQANSGWRQDVLTMMLQRAQGEPLDAHDAALAALTNPRLHIKDRTAALTPLLTDAFNVESRFKEQYGVQGAGDMVTSITRALKALVKYGWQDKLQQQTATSAGSAGEAATQFPPGYVLEIFVVWVFENRLQQYQGGAAPYQHGPIGEFLLFKEVLLEMSQRLHPVSEAESERLKLIMLSSLYSAEQCEMFRDCWGDGEVATPFIIHPADPSCNCVEQTSFRQWGVLAEAAEKLHQQLEQALQQHSGADNAWEEVVETSTLGRAVKAFCEDAA